MPHEVMVHVDGAADQTDAATLVKQALDRYGCQARIETVYRVAVRDVPPCGAARLSAGVTISDAFHHGLMVNEKHVRGFYTQRPHGSQWGRHIPGSVSAWAAGVAWRRVPHDQLPPGTANPACQYFKTNDPALLNGAVEHVALSTMLDRSLIHAGAGPHGRYLYTTQELPKCSATEAWLILGPAAKDDPKLIPWTAFPGRMAAAPPPDWDGDLQKLDLENVPYGVRYISPETVELIA